MRRGNAVAQACCAGRLTSKDIFFVLFFVLEVAALFHQVNQMRYGIGFILDVCAQINARIFEQISNSHSALLLTKKLIDNF